MNKHHFHVLLFMETTKAQFKKPRKTNQECSQEKDQESAVLQALGNLERKLDLLHDLLLQSESEQEDGEEYLDDEESSSM